MSARRRSVDRRTSGMVMARLSRISSRISPRASICAIACRISSPTRNWRCEGPERFAYRRWAMAPSHAIGGLAAMGGPRGASQLERTPDALEIEALDEIGHADVLIVGERHAALLAGRHLPHLVLEALEGRQRTLVDHHVVAD